MLKPHNQKYKYYIQYVTHVHIYIHILRRSGPGSVFGIATGDRIPVVARFFAPVQTGPEAHPASCTMGTAFFPGVRCGQGVTLTPHPLLVPRSKIE